MPDPTRPGTSVPGTQSCATPDTQIRHNEPREPIRFDRTDGTTVEIPMAAINEISALGSRPLALWAYILGHPGGVTVDQIRITRAVLGGKDTKDPDLLADPLGALGPALDLLAVHGYLNRTGDTFEASVPTGRSHD